MKVIAIILALLLFSPPAVPCSDEHPAEDLCQNETGDHHNHQDENEDSCAMTCICSCCGTTITYQPIPNFNLELNADISSSLFSTYQSIYRFGFLANIWQPPKVIS